MCSKIVTRSYKATMLSRFLKLLPVGIIFLSAGLLEAKIAPGLIDVDFNGNSVGQAYNGGGVATGPTQSGAAVIGSAGDIWNGFSDSDMGFTDQANVTGPINSGSLALNYADGSSSGASMVINAAGSYDANEPTWGNTSAFTTAGSPYSNLMQDEVYTTAPETLTLSGLAANQNFDLIIYSAGDQNLGTGNTEKEGTFTVNGITQNTIWDGTTSTLIAGKTYVQFSATSDGSGNLVINYGGTPAATGVNQETDFTGFQLRVVPEPSTWALLAISGALLFISRRSLRCI
jgi:hypothetical protein